MISPRLEHQALSLDLRVVVGSLAAEETLLAVNEEDFHEADSAAMHEVATHEAASVEEEAVAAGVEVEVDVAVDVGAEGHHKEGAMVT